MKTISCLLLCFILTSQVLSPIGVNASVSPSYQLDGSFTQTLVQAKTPARSEQKAVYNIAIGANIHPNGVVMPGTPQYFFVDGFRFDFRGTNDNSVTASVVNVRTPTYDYINPNAAATAAHLSTLLTSFTSPDSGIVYNVSTSGRNITITTAGTETRDNANIPVNNLMNYDSQYFIPGLSSRTAMSEIIDFTPLNPRTGEIFSLTLSGQTYTTTGTTVSEIISGILAAIVANPSPVGNCVGMSTYIRCTSIDSLTSLSASSSVIYPGADSTAPLVTRVGPGTITLAVGDTYNELGATWIDNRDGTGSIVSPYTGSVTTNQPGIYTLSYRYVDIANNTSNIVTRIVTVNDVVAPIVTVLGSGTIIHELDVPYVDSGATWFDDIEGAGTVTASGITLMTATGVYTLTYTQTDAGGNVGTGSREVTIVDNIAPVVTITTPSASVNANSYKISGTAPGATSISITGGSSSVSITPSNGVFAAFVPLTQDAINTLIVTATDASGNIGTGSVLITETSSGNLFVSAITVSGSTFSGATTYSGGSFTTTTQVTTQTPVTFVSSSGASSVIPSGTIITSASGGAMFDASSINALSVTVTGGLASNETPQSALEFGISGSGLHFSRPIMIQIPVIGYTGTTIPVKVKHGGTSVYVTTGLTNNSNSTCTNGVSSSPSALATVSGGLATIYTCAASTFVTYTETVVVSNSNIGGGGGGSYTSPVIPSVLTFTGNTVQLRMPISSNIGSMDFVVDSKSFRSSKIIKTTTTEKNGTRIFVSRILPNGKSRLIGTTRVLRGEIRYRIPVQGKYKFALTK